MGYESDCFCLEMDPHFGQKVDAKILLENIDDGEEGDAQQEKNDGKFDNPENHVNDNDQDEEGSDKYERRMHLDDLLRMGSPESLILFIGSGKTPCAFRLKK
jgi:hypothetical protein